MIDEVTPFPRPPMPPEIAAAIVSVMAKVKPLPKDLENKFQHYSYVSVDQFFEAVGRLMSEAGIFVMAFETSIEISKQATTDDYGKVKESVWMLAVYDLYIYHKSGAVFGPIQRSIRVPASGAQSYASAMSFVEKYFLRSLFKIPTGDLDEDANDKRELPPTQGRASFSSGRQGPPPPPPPPSPPPRKPFDFEAYRNALNSAPSIDAINSLYDRGVKNRGLTEEEAKEAQAILLEACERFEKDQE